jgi:hypothetical protein
MAFYEMARYPKAGDAFSKAVELAPDDARPPDNFGALSRKLEARLNQNKPSPTPSVCAPGNSNL